MWIHIDTVDLHGLRGDFAPAELLRALHHVCAAGDRIVLGSYDISDAAAQALHALGARLPSPPQGIHLDASCYDLNRRKYPRGRPYELDYTPDVVAGLVDLCKMPGGGGVDKDVFFDSLFAYRIGSPPRPLIDFNHVPHGTMYLTGWVDAAHVHALAAELRCRAFRVRRTPGTDDFVELPG